MKINICIVHYNTPYMTECLIKSINKFVGLNCNIYIFDNSDKQPFTYRQENITIFDNTNGQIINFDEWLPKLVLTSHGKENNYGSFKHCLSTQKCIEMIDDDFILMDSDVLLKKNISNLYKKDKIFIGEIQHYKNGVHHNVKAYDRIYPFICFINVNMLKLNSIKFFNEEYIYGLGDKINEWWDTGAYFFQQTKKYDYEEIKMDDYIIHYGSASFVNNINGYSNNKNKVFNWLSKHSNLYTEKHNTENVIISFTTYKNRVKYAPKVIKSLLNQTIKPYKICLTLYKEDLQYITPELQVFFDNGEVELIISDIDIAPHKKWYNAMKKYKEYPIITVDDDVIYNSNLVEKLYNGYLKNNMCISAGRTHKIKYNIHGMPLPYNQWQYEYKEVELEPSFDLFATGIGGVLYPPNILQVDDISINDIMDCLYADDVFLKKRENDLNIKVQWINGNNLIFGKSINIPEIQNNGLALTNNLKGRNDMYIKNIGLKKKEEEEKNKQVIYTCITGNYEKLVDPTVVSENFEYICFTDNANFQSNVWTIKPIPEELKELSKVKQQRVIKICPHKYLSEYDLSIWVDGCVDILGDLNTFLEEQCLYEKQSLFIPKHPIRKCIYEESIACLSLRKDTKENISPQIEKYKKENFPSNYGMVQTGIMIRKHNDEKCIEIMECWKDELIKHSHRDQLSFNYALWKTNNNNEIKYLDKNLFNSKYFKWYSKHNRSINNNNYKQEYSVNECHINEEPTRAEKIITQKKQTKEQENYRSKKIDDPLLRSIYENI